MSWETIFGIISNCAYAQFLEMYFGMLNFMIILSKMRYISY